MKTTTEMEIKVSNGRIICADVQDGICKLVIEVAEVVPEVKEDEKSEEVSEVKESEELFVHIEASKLSLQDKFMQYKPKTANECKFKDELKEVIGRGITDFYIPRIAPSFDDDGMICFNPGMQPAVGKSYNWWAENAKKFNLERKSRLGTKSEYVAFLGVLLKKLIEERWSKDEAWDMVCNEELGHYWNPEKGKYDFETTGSRERCGFFDLDNTCKILAEDIEVGGFWLASGCFSYYIPLAVLRHNCNRYGNLYGSVGWLVLEK